MRKLIAIVCALIGVLMISGCGGGSTATTIFPAKIALTDADVSGKTFYSTTTRAYVSYVFNSGHTVGSSTDKWQISSDGAIDWTDAGGVPQHKFYCLQKETAYWLVYDALNNNTITRFYFDSAVAQAYLNSIAVAPSGFKLGGEVQGMALPAVFKNVTTVAGQVGTPPSKPVDGTSTAASFNQPVGITTDGTNLYVADYKYNIIQKIVIASNTVTRLSGSPSGVAGLADSAATDTNGDTATFNLPSAITTDGTALYVADQGNNCIRKVDMITGVAHVFAGSTTAVAGTVDALGTDARFNQPSGITTDGTYLYVVDSGNQIIRRIVISNGTATTSGAVTTIAGAAGSIGSSDSTDHTGATARFNSPARITTDGTNLYVTDFGNRTIRKIVIATGEVSTPAGKAGTAPGSNDDDDGTKARFGQPNGITTDGTNLYVTDSSNHTIRRISLTAPYEVKKIADISGSPGAVNTAGGAVASFNDPTGITTDGKSLFVVDSKNNMIRKLQ